MEKKNLKLSQLIETMRGIAAEGNRFVKGDTFHDVVKIVSDIEEVEAADLEDVYMEAEWHWCLRKNGTRLGSFSNTVEEFGKEYADEAVAAYKIHYSARHFTIERVKEYGNEFYD